MAWLLLVLLSPAVGARLPVLRQQPAGAPSPRPPAQGQRADLRPRRRAAADGRYPQVCRTSCRASSTSAVQLGGLPLSLDNDVELLPTTAARSTRWPRRPTARELRRRRVLHLRLGRRHRAGVRGDGRGGASEVSACGSSSTTWGPAGSPATRTSASVSPPRTSPGTRCCRCSRCKAGSGDPTSATTASSPSSTAGRLHRLAEPHRARLQQAEEPCCGPRVGGADGAGPRPRRRLPLRGLRAGLVRRDRRDQRRRPDRGAGRHLAAARSPACRARWSRAVPATSGRATCGCSPPCCTAPATGSRSPAPTSCPTSRCCTPSPPPRVAASRSSCSSASSPTSSWSATHRRRTTARCWRRGSGSTSTRRRGSCTASTSPSTTTSP